MKQGWEPEKLRETSEQIQQAVAPKSITPDMVGGTLLGLVDAMENVAAHRTDVGVYSFDGIIESSTSDLSGYADDDVVYDSETKIFIRKRNDGWLPAGDEYNESLDKDIYGARTDRLFRYAGCLYRIRENDLVRLIDEKDADNQASEFRREIIGLWDATAEMQAKLADLYSTETRNLLKRLGYEEEDIEEYIWAVGHLVLPLTMDDLRTSVVQWESRDSLEEGRLMICKVIPKWTEEMEAGDSTPADFLRRFEYASIYYLPFLRTGKMHWLDRVQSQYYFYPRPGYVAGIHSEIQTEVVLYADKLIGIGSVTGLISRFCISSPMPDKLRFIRKFKSDIPVDLSSAFKGAYNLCDLRGIDISNAANLSFFSYCDNNRTIYNTLLPASGLPEMIDKQSAFVYRMFKDTVLDMSACSDGSIEDIFKFARFDNCDIKISSMTRNTLGTVIAVPGTKSRISMPNMLVLQPEMLIGLDSGQYLDTDESSVCGVWEVDCPRIGGIYEGANLFNHRRASMTLWNIEMPNTNIFLQYIMPRYQSRPGSVIAESLRESLKTWKPIERTSRIYLYTEQYACLTEEDLADITAKGYTVVVNDGRWP